uniref:Mitochondrial glutathione transporter SLC25A39 n=1 Tax=Melopsittacus undulatus TaxID=13146 RepID=A0A8V5GXG6_MELUD
MAERTAPSTGGSITPVQQMVASGTGAILTSLFVTPLDVVKIRLQAQRTPFSNGKCFLYCNGLMDHLYVCQHSTGCSAWYRSPTRFNGTLDAFVKITRYEGIRSLWSGLPPTLVMAVPATVIYFTTYDQLRDHLQTHMGSRAPHIPLLAGALARLGAVTVISPLELIRTKIQSRPLSYRQLRVCIRSAVVQDGWLSLWRGWGPTVLRDVPFSALYWFNYELVKDWLCRQPWLDGASFMVSFTSGAISGTVSMGLWGALHWALWGALGSMGSTALGSMESTALGSMGSAALGSMGSTALGSMGSTAVGSMGSTALGLYGEHCTGLYGEHCTGLYGEHCTGALWGALHWGSMGSTGLYGEHCTGALWGALHWGSMGSTAVGLYGEHCSGALWGALHWALWGALGSMGSTAVRLYGEHCTGLYGEHCTGALWEHCTGALWEHCTGLYGEHWGSMGSTALGLYGEHCTGLYGEHCTGALWEHCSGALWGALHWGSMGSTALGLYGEHCTGLYGEHCTGLYGEHCTGLYGEPHGVDGAGASPWVTAAP